MKDKPHAPSLKVHRTSCSLLRARSMDDDDTLTSPSASTPDSILANTPPKDVVDVVTESWTALLDRPRLIENVLTAIRDHNADVYVIWPFGRLCKNPGTTLPNNNNIDDSTTALVQKHAKNVEQSLNKIIKYLPTKPQGVTQFIRKLGERHFYYGAAEPYYRLFTNMLLAQIKIEHMKSCKWSDAQEGAWKSMFDYIVGELSKATMGERWRYMKSCLNDHDVMELMEQWDHAKHVLGAEKLSINWYKETLQAYTQLINNAGLSKQFATNGKLTTEPLAMKSVAKDILDIVEIAQEHLPENVTELPEAVEKYVTSYLVGGVCPYFVKQAVKQSLLKVVAQTTSKQIFSEAEKTRWNKLLEIIAQAVAVKLLEKCYT